MIKTTSQKVAMVSRAQRLLAVAFFVSCAANASESELDIGYGFGWDDNIFYSEIQEQDEVFGILDVDFEYDHDLSDKLELSINAVYEDKHFSGESDARNRFFSGFTELQYKGDGFIIGGQLDPQYSQFVTSDTDGGLILEGAQRIHTLKARLFTEVDINDASSLEVGVERKEKDYRNSDSDYDADIVDLRLRNKLSDNFRLDVGAEREERDYDERLARDVNGDDILAQTLEIKRTTWFIKGTWDVSDQQSYSLEYKQRKNEDGAEDYYGHDKNQMILRSKYRWENDIAFKTKIKISDKSYDEQLGDDGGRLDDDKSGVDLELEVPMSLMCGNDCNNWYTRFTFEWDDYESDQATKEFDKNSFWFTVHRVFD